MNFCFSSTKFFLLSSTYVTQKSENYEMSLKMSIYIYRSYFSIPNVSGLSQTPKLPYRHHRRQIRRFLTTKMIRRPCWSYLKTRCSTSPTSSSSPPTCRQTVDTDKSFYTQVNIDLLFKTKLYPIVKIVGFCYISLLLEYSLLQTKFIKSCM